jgi:hypothetical protein
MELNCVHAANWGVLMKRTLYVGPVVLISALLLAACGSPSAVTTTTTTSSTTTSTTTTTTNTSRPTQNLAVTPAVIKSILDAGAKYHQLPATDYTGLDPGTAYYAFDPANNTFYAAAGLDPSPHSLKAQVGAQDDGGYNLFVRLASNTNWTVYNDGLGGADGSVCPILIPPSVLAVWNWKPGSCMFPQ